MTNAARHSGTDRCVLEIEVDETDLLIRCRDAGSGIAADAVVGVGTRSMIERAEEQGGTVTRSAGVPSGTVVTATLPLRRAGEDDPRMSDAVIKVVVVDDHPVFRLGMVGLLGSLDGIRVTGQAADRAGLAAGDRRAAARDLDGSPPGHAFRGERVRDRADPLAAVTPTPRSPSW